MTGIWSVLDGGRDYPPPTIDELLDRVKTVKCLTAFDLVHILADGIRNTGVQVQVEWLEQVDEVDDYAFWSHDFGRWWDYSPLPVAVCAGLLTDTRAAAALDRLRRFSAAHDGLDGILLYDWAVPGTYEVLETADPILAVTVEELLEELRTAKLSEAIERIKLDRLRGLRW